MIWINVFIILATFCGVIILFYRQRHKHQWTYPPDDPNWRCCLTCNQLQERSSDKWRNSDAYKDE